MFVSCSGQKVDKYLATFKKNEAKFSAITQFIELYKDTLLELGCNSYTKGLQIDVDYTSVHKKCYAGFNDTLESFFKMEIFKALSIYKNGEIEYLLEFSPAKTIMSVETTRYYFYCINNELPKPYDTWPVKIKLKDHWWYLEYTNSGF